MKEFKDGFKLKWCDQLVMNEIPKHLQRTGYIPVRGNNERWPLWRMLVGQCFDLPYDRRRELPGLIRYIIRYQNQCLASYNEPKLFRDELIPGRTPVHRITRIR
jgi:hypothetical protein